RKRGCSIAHAWAPSTRCGRSSRRRASSRSRSSGARSKPRAPRSLEEATGDDLRLDLVRSLENRENARVDEQPRGRVLLGVAVTAVDLDAGVGGLPGRAGGEELRHARLEVAPLAAVRRPRGEIGELSGGHDAPDHPAELARDAGEGRDGVAK